MGLHVAAASADITPQHPAVLAGGMGRLPFTGIQSRLEANAIAFKEETGRAVVLVAIDTLFVGPMLGDVLREHFIRIHGQRGEDLFLFASHTHYAPALDATKPLLGRTDREYVALVIDRAKGLLDWLLDQVGTVAAIERRSGSSLGAVNRRKPWPLPYLAGRRGIRLEAAMAPNTLGSTDPTVTLWTVARSSGEPVAVIWHYTCHPTGYPSDREVSAEFPGVVREALRQRLGHSLPVVFLQGFAGDIRPSVPEDRPFMDRTLRCLAFGPSFPKFDRAGWTRWSQALAEEVVRLSRSSEKLDVPVERVRTSSYSVPLSRIVRGNNVDRPVHFARLRLDSHFDLIAVAAEPLVGLRRFMPSPYVTPVGYLGDVFGYWPTEEDARHGGYEVKGYFRPFSLHGRLQSGLDSVFRSAIQGLAIHHPGDALSNAG
jgi:hypothetical protein